MFPAGSAQLVVEVVEHQERRVAVQRSSEEQEGTVRRGQGLAPLAKLRVLPSRQGRHLLVQADAGEHLTDLRDLGVGLPVAHGARDRGPLQSHALGGVPEKPSPFAEADRAEVPAVDANRACRGMTDADQGQQGCGAPLPVARLHDDPVAGAGIQRGQLDLWSICEPQALHDEARLAEERGAGARPAGRLRPGLGGPSRGRRVRGRRGQRGGQHDAGGPIGLSVLDHAPEILDGSGENPGHGQAGRQSGAVEAGDHAAGDDGDRGHGCCRGGCTADSTEHPRPVDGGLDDLGAATLEAAKLAVAASGGPDRGGGGQGVGQVAREPATLAAHLPGLLKSGSAGHQRTTASASIGTSVATASAG